ncbi:MAG: 1-acyl-sn-glycerol-3-phosphate acyltransferase [Rhizobacter sp.]|nr:1-acyl-sn-glycerol-3-phosphate acyltransferase [Rhizobacter sp.]
MVLTERPVQLAGSAFALRLLRLFGWKLVYSGLPARQGVIIVYPHTSNWDFVVGLLAKWAIGIPATFWGKDSLFKLPLVGRWMRWIGGIPVDRHAAQGVVGQMGDALREAKAHDRFMWLALAPEGTRSYRDAWRSGFYHVALAAGVPLGLACFDYARREVVVDRFMALTGDMAADMAEISAYMGGTVGKRPALAAPIRLKP